MPEHVLHPALNLGMRLHCLETQDIPGESDQLEVLMPVPSRSPEEYNIGLREVGGRGL